MTQNKEGEMNILIKKDHNYRSNHFLNRFTVGYKWSEAYTVKFDVSCQYHLTANETQVNKLVGVGHVHHHLNSIRVGWRWNYRIGLFELVAYRYRNGRVDYAPLCNVPVNKEVDIIITYKYEKGSIVTVVYCSGSSVQFVWKTEHWYEKIPFLYECFPYFGGYMPAPNDIRISIKRL